MTLITLLFACNNTPEIDGPTFYQDVAPILDTYCMRCHVDGGIGPVSFETYDEVVSNGPSIVAFTESRIMPPKQVIADGTCGDFQDPWWMTDEEIAVLSDWVATGMEEGEVEDRNPPEPFPSLEATHSVTSPVFEPVPVGGDLAEFDEYRCFAMPVEDMDGDMFLTGFDVAPGNSAIVHHVIGHIVDPNADSDFAGRTNAEQMAALDAESPDRPGWPCFSGAGDDVEYSSDPMGWAPGQGATNFPAGTGVAMPEGSWIVTQIHYNLSNPETLGTTDSTELQIKLSPPSEVSKPMYVIYLDFLLAFGDTLPADRPNYRYRNSVSLQELDVPISIDIVGVMPHMHQYGQRLNATILRDDGSEECIVEVPEWDFDWQYIYFYETPVTVDPADLFELTCWFDTTTADDDVLAGWGTQNEMCLTILWVTL